MPLILRQKPTLASCWCSYLALALRVDLEGKVIQIGVILC